jgi:hypothetical protein
MKFIFTIFFFSFSGLFAQPSDFIILKKGNKRIATYFAESNISFVTVSGAFINAKINQIRNDTLYLQEFLVQRALTTLGTYFYDTVGSYHYKFHYNQISEIGKNKRQNFDWQGSGGVLLGGGTLLTLGSAVVYLIDRNKFSAPLMIASVGLATLGYFMAKGKSNSIHIGKKYRIVYMGLTGKQH